MAIHWSKTASGIDVRDLSVKKLLKQEQGTKICAINKIGIKYKSLLKDNGKREAILWLIRYNSTTGIWEQSERFHLQNNVNVLRNPKKDYEAFFMQFKQIELERLRELRGKRLYIKEFKLKQQTSDGTK